MTKQNEELLFKDLCSRLPYGVIVNNNGNQGKLLSIEANPYIGKIVYLIILHDSRTADYISNIKPYLRPMSSMTEEEKEEYDNFYPLLPRDLMPPNIALQMFDWLNAHHFDYRGLIERKLAINCSNLHIYD